MLYIYGGNKRLLVMLKDDIADTNEKLNDRQNAHASQN